MSHDLGANLDQLLPQGRHRPMLDTWGEGEPAKKVAQVVCQGEQLQPHPIVQEVVTRKSSPFYCILAFLDPLLRRAAPVVKLHYRVITPTQVRDNEAHAWKQLTLMPFHFGHHATGGVPTLGLIGETLVDSFWGSGWSACWTCQQMLNGAL